ncbi:hypothetical protein EJB05_44035 [Eragrostis curvula]|uniref:Uncharacterized protein n=1 Tax=Eragrostis curvula TaxID=38414 RepID=A0A5J9TGJ7_9POAL|nr:hypothetical protein EJB05_44035 [Eragrostis curvula]
MRRAESDGRYQATAKDPPPVILTRFLMGPEKENLPQAFPRMSMDRSIRQCIELEKGPTYQLEFPWVCFSIWSYTGNAT